MRVNKWMSLFSNDVRKNVCVFNELTFLIWIYFTKFFDPADCTVVHYVANCLCYIDIYIFYIYIILSVCVCVIGRIKAFSLNLVNVRCSMLTFMTLIDMKSSIHEIHWQFEDARKANVQCNKNSSMSVSWVLVWKLGRGAGVGSCVHSSTVLQLYYSVIVSYIPSLHKWVRKPYELRPTRRISTHHNELQIIEFIITVWRVLLLSWLLAQRSLGHRLQKIAFVAAAGCRY